MPIDPNLSVANSGLQLIKIAGSDSLRRGDFVRYELRLTNVSDNDYAALSLIDTLPPGLGFVSGSAELDGLAQNPAAEARTLVFSGFPIAAGETRSFIFRTRAGANVTPGQLINSAVVATASGAVVSNEATVAITLEAEAIFDCGDVIGKVFDDRNRNGYQDRGEPGIAAARVVTVRGTLITADKFGRFSVPCAELPDREIGSTFILKLDTRSLPVGSRVVSENPRLVRLTAGRVTEMNFAVARPREVDIDLDASAFRPDSVAYTDALGSAIDSLLARIEGDDTIIRLTYAMPAKGERANLAHLRLGTLKRALQWRWDQSGASANLIIETRIASTASEIPTGSTPLR